MFHKLDQLQFCRWHYYVVIALGTTWVFDGFEISMLSLVNNQLMSYFNKSESQIGLLSSIYLSGCCTGAVIFSCFAFKFGRKQLFNITLIIYAISVIGASLSYEFEFLIFFRFTTGVSVGGEYTAIFAAVDELIPAKVRGRVDIILDGTWALGGIIASVVALIIYSWTQANWVWRIQFAFGIIGVLPIIKMRQSIPESPRWLLFRGRVQECQKVIEYIEHCCNYGIIKMQDFEKNSGIEEIREQQQSSYISQDMKSFTLQMAYVLCKKYPKRLILGLVLMSTQAFFYQGIYYTFSLQIRNYYHCEQKEIYILMMPLTIAGFLGTLIFGKYFDTLGRKIMIEITYTLSGLWLIMIGILMIYFEINKYVYVTLFFFLFLVASPGGSSAHLTVSEIFPSEMRSQALALFFAIGLGVGGVISPYFFSLLIQQNSAQTFAYGCFLAASLMIIAGIVGGMCAIQAENLTLEEISSFEMDTKKLQGLNYVHDDITDN